jgi:hypothetical protein
VLRHAKEVGKMIQSFDEAGKYGKEFLDNGLKSFASLSTGTQAIVTEAGDYSKKAFEAGATALEKLMAARSLEKAMEVQADYARNAYEGFVAEATKIGELYTNLCKDAYKPFETAFARAK